MSSQKNLKVFQKHAYLLSNFYGFLTQSQYSLLTDILWLTSNQNLSRFFQGIINDDLNEVQIMVDKSLETKCHPLCNCDKCDNIENLMTLKEDSNYRTPLMLASWLGMYSRVIGP